MGKQMFKMDSRENEVQRCSTHPLHSPPPQNSSSRCRAPIPTVYFSSFTTLCPHLKRNEHSMRNLWNSSCGKVFKVSEHWVLWESSSKNGLEFSQRSLSTKYCQGSLSTKFEEFSDPLVTELLETTKRANRGKPPICKGCFEPDEIITLEFESERKKSEVRRFFAYSFQSAVLQMAFPPLESLNVISLRKIIDSVNKIHWDHILYATTIVVPFKTCSVHVVIRDTEGQACLLCICCNHDKRHENMFAGTHIAVLAPYMKHSGDDPQNGAVMLRCDNPEGVIIFETESDSWLKELATWRRCRFL